MAFHHRKLLNESATFITIAHFCEPFCDPIINPSGICPPSCFDFCDDSCTAVNLAIPPPPPPPVDLYRDYSHHHAHALKLSLLLVVFLSILVPCFFLFSCYTIYRFLRLNRYSGRRRAEPRLPDVEEPGGLDGFLGGNHGPAVDHYVWYIRTAGLEPSVISKIAIVKYNKGEGLIESTDCAVCLSEFEEDETLRLLPKCNHAFHIPCIDTWLNSHTNCPVCRAGVVVQLEEPVILDSGLGEGTSRPGVSGDNRGVMRESEDRASELRIRIRGENESRDLMGLKRNESDGGLGEIQPIRRSVSMDSLSASMISNAISIKFPSQSIGAKQGSVEMKESNKNFVGSLQTSSSSVTRSLSCSSRLFLSRYGCGTRESVIHR